MRTFAKALILSLALASLASCAPTGKTDSCAGWWQVQIKPETADYMAAHDPDALETMIGNQEFGAKMGCWK